MIGSAVKAGTLTDCIRYGNCGIIPTHHLSPLFRSHQLIPIVLAALVAGSACRRQETPAPPVATPSVRLNHDKAPLGSPIDITYKFVVAPDAHFDQNYRVMAHVVDADDQLMWDDDHEPPLPT